MLAPFQLRQTAKTYRSRHAVDLLSEYLQHAATLDDLTPDVLRRWIAWLFERYTTYTAWQYRSEIISLWRKYRTEPPPRLMRKPRLLPIAWTLEEIQAILVACEGLQGAFPMGAQRSSYCVGLVLSAWDTGLRRSDLWTLDRDRIRQDGTVVMAQHKTGVPHYPRLRPATVAIVLSLPGRRPLANPYRTQRAWYTFWRDQVIKPSGVRPGCLQQLRRSGATHLASEHPEAVQRYLGHSSPEMVAWYVDWSIARPQQFLPPQLPPLTGSAPPGQFG